MHLVVAPKASGHVICDQAVTVSVEECKAHRPIVTH